MPALNPDFGKGKSYLLWLPLVCSIAALPEDQAERYCLSPDPLGTEELYFNCVLGVLEGKPRGRESVA